VVNDHFTLLVTALKRPSLPFDYAGGSPGAETLALFPAWRSL
jgi:hypothetical protein